jgi:septum formation protein
VEEGYIMAADSIVAVGRRTLPKALTSEDVIQCLKLLSGRRHKVYTGVAIFKKHNGILLKRSRLVETIVKFKSLTDNEIAAYSKLEDGLNKAGGYSIQGYAESFITYISGSFSNVVGLPLFETKNMLVSLGFFDNTKS